MYTYFTRIKNVAFIGVTQPLKQRLLIIYFSVFDVLIPARIPALT